MERANERCPTITVPAHCSSIDFFHSLFAETYTFLRVLLVRYNVSIVLDFQISPFEPGTCTLYMLYCTLRERTSG